MPHSMTAFASRTGSLGHTSWQWEMRGVNARGLDLRLRIPDAVAAVEPVLRKSLTAALSRGSVTVNLRLNRDEQAGAVKVDAAQLDDILKALDAVQDRAFEIGVTLAQPTAADVLSQRGVLVAAGADEDGGQLVELLTADIDVLISEFVNMRATEGGALTAVISEHLATLERLVAAAMTEAEARAPQMRENIAVTLRRVVEDISEVEPSRIAQELALIAVKSDVTEELDRLTSHIQAARDLLAMPQPCGRKLDFLAQEFNREANTLCAKAQSKALTSIGLELKAVIDQMREQIQNME